MSDPDPFESDDDLQIRELDLDSVDTFGDERITVGELVDENESWRFGHVIVDEAQDLTPMQWRMVMRRVRGRSLTIVGDLAQRSAEGAASWREILPPELADAVRQDLTINYRSPIEVHDLAVKVLAAFAPDVEPSQAIRVGDEAPEFVHVHDVAAALPGIIETALDRVGGQVAVLAATTAGLVAASEGFGDRVRLLSPVEAKGLEFDAVVLVEPAAIWRLPAGPAQLYIALTRATQRLTLLYNEPLPAALR